VLTQVSKQCSKHKHDTIKISTRRTVHSKDPVFPLEYDYYEMPSEKCQINNTDMKNKVTY
jgi:hypothetical protein